MLKSLFSGVSGLKSHQVAMDVESNNIANVNTTGFKYSRANFSDLLAQTKAVATAPQGDLGGQNAVQVGLGTSVSSITTIFSQGTVESTDKNTDMAIEGDGFFIVSPDGGTTYNYTRNGDFAFDASGNFVDSNGYTVQGWLRDEDTGLVDTTGSITDIIIDPGLTTPANSTSEVLLKANLNSGDTVESMSPAYSIDTAGLVEGGNASGDLGVLFNAAGEAFSLQDGQGVNISFDGGTTTFKYTYDSDDTNTATGIGADKVFKTLADLRDAIAIESGGNVSVNEQGSLVINNTTAATMEIVVDAYTDATTVENARFTESMNSLVSTLPAGSTSSAYSQSFNAATHSSSLDVYDSLGTKHSLSLEFRKTGINDASGTTWDINISVPNPGTIDTIAPLNEKAGSISFTNNGALSTYEPTSIYYSANNGSADDQQIKFDLGSANGFDGMTSFDSDSSTSNITQDGYTGGDLNGLSIDASGTLIGTFSNGRSFGLAQTSMAVFANNDGLTSEGGSVYSSTANSGEPIIGTAATAGRGTIKSSSLESSNVDLATSLTELIIIQRGFQANGKTITTSDELLQTLLGLKN